MVLIPVTDTSWEAEFSLGRCVQREAAETRKAKNARGMNFRSQTYASRVLRLFCWC